MSFAIVESKSWFYYHMDSHLVNSFRQLYLVGDRSSVSWLCVRHQSHATKGTPHIGNHCPFRIRRCFSAVVMFGFYGYISVLSGEYVSADSLFRIFDSVDFRQCISGEVIIPWGITDMFLNHHILPFAAGHNVVIIVTQRFIPCKSLFHFICPFVSLRIVFFIQFMVHGLCIIHFVQVCHGLNGEED